MQSPEDSVAAPELRVVVEPVSEDGEGQSADEGRGGQCWSTRTACCAICKVIPETPVSTVSGALVCEPCFAEHRGNSGQRQVVDSVCFQTVDRAANNAATDVKLKRVLPALFPREYAAMREIHGLRAGPDAGVAVGLARRMSEAHPEYNPDILALVWLKAFKAQSAASSKNSEQLESIATLLALRGRRSNSVHRTAVQALDDLRRALGEESDARAQSAARSAVLDGLKRAASCNRTAANSYEVANWSALERNSDEDRADAGASSRSSSLEHELECACCLSVLYMPVTLPSGHAVCGAPCLQRCLELTDPATGTAAPPACPMTRERLDAYFAWLNRAGTRQPGLLDAGDVPINAVLDRIVRNFFAKDLEERQRELQREEQIERDDAVQEIPVFVCNVAFPGVRCDLHVFEPRYRLMMRRALASPSRSFGMCAPAYHAPFADIGTMLKIESQTMLPDGRSLVRSVGARRFRVLERGMRDGYHTARVEFFEDEAESNDAEEAAASGTSLFAKAERLRAVVLHSLQQQGALDKFEDALGPLPSAEQDASALSFWITALVPGRLQEFLLTERSCLRRLEILSDVLLPVMEE